MKFLKTTALVSVFAVSALAAAPALAKKAAKEPSLLDKAIEVNTEGDFAGAFSTLLMVAGMDEEIVDVLTSKGQRTLFAPTDTAFAALSEAAEANCIDLNAETVNAVLKYHVVKGRRGSDDVLESDNIRTLLGAFFGVEDDLIVDNAGQVVGFVATDVPASNGIIHAIDTVLLPFPVVNACEEE